MRVQHLAAVGAVLLFACGAPDPERESEAAGNRSTTLRAFGNEPFWHVDISSTGGLVYNRLGEESISFPYVEPQVDTSGTSVTYGPVADMTGEHTLLVILGDEPCQDTMADVVHPMSASVTIDSDDLLGCARTIGDTADGESPPS